MCRKIGKNCLSGVVRVMPIGVRNGGERLYDMRDIGFKVQISVNYMSNFHISRSNCSGLIQTECINAGKRLNAVRLLDKHFLKRKTGGGNGQNRRGQKHQTLRNHTDNGGNRR